MSRTLRRSALAALVLGAGVAWYSVQPATGQGYVPSTKNGDWTHYTADVHGTKYSPLDQITAANFNKLEVAWRFKTEHLGPRPEFNFEATPLMVKGVMVARDFPPFEKTMARITLGTMEEMQKAVTVFGDVLAKKSTAAA